MKKGQILSVEQMILFAVGIIITMTVFFSFNTVKGEIKNFVEKEQLEEIGQLIDSGISEVYATGYNNSLKLNVPEKIHTKTYKIILQDNPKMLKVKLLNERKSVKFNLTHIPVYMEENSLAGSKGVIKILYNGNNIKLER